MTSRNLSELLESGWSGQLGDKVPAHARVSPCSVLSPDGWPSSDSSSPASPVLQPLHELRPAINAAKPQLKKGLRKRRQRSVEAQQPQPAWQKPTGQPTWVGELVPTFEVAGNGSNPYVILQITDSRTGNSRVIVRGRSGASEQQTLQQVQRQLAQIAAKHSLPLMAVELLAGGNLESRKGLASKAPTIFPIGVVW
ncbi:hypothetical protein WJX72_005389 [[Myrmecia] bisecta]|uniref:Uncharacterized protein n=1 Tax=[Myrmecia] bisecta TaxID=41462 RepID=A0AAW1PG42_9CHLO